MTRSDYNYQFSPDNAILAIIDLNLGNMSVTNDMENVLSSIRKENHITVDKMRGVYIIYQDSEQQWDRVIYYSDDDIEFKSIVLDHWPDDDRKRFIMQFIN